MKSTTLTVAVAAMVIFVQSAQAREHHHGRHHHSLVARRGHLCRDAVSAKRTVCICRREPCAYYDAVSRARPSAAGCLVRLGDAPSRRRRSGSVIQPGAQLGALGQAGTGGNWRGGRMGAPCRQDRWSEGRRMDHRIG